MSKLVPKEKRRRIVTGWDADGKPKIVSDGPAPVTVESAAFDVVETWRLGGLPADFGPDETVIGDPAMEPGEGEVLFRFAYFAPDPGGPEAWEEAMAAMAASDTLAGEEDAGRHTTDTFDHIIVVSGQISLIVEDSAVDLEPGDVVIQRGTPHTWINRSDEPAVTLAVQVPADPSTRPQRKGAGS